MPFRFEAIFCMLPFDVVQRIVCFHRMAAAEAIRNYWSAEHRGKTAAVTIFHDQLGMAASSIRQAVQPLLPRVVDDYGSTLYFIRPWHTIEAELDGLRVHFPKLRYVIRAVESTCDGKAGVYRVHINRRFKKIVTKHARRTMCISR